MIQYVVDEGVFKDALARKMTGNQRATRDNLVCLRQPYWDHVQYSANGATSYNFFTKATGSQATGADLQITNLPASGRFQDPFLLKSIYMSFFIKNFKPLDYAGEDADTLYSDIVAGIFQAGVLEFVANSGIQFEIPVPFIMAPPQMGEPQLKTAGLKALTLVDGTPNTWPGTQQMTPVARLAPPDAEPFLLAPPMFIDVQDPFQVTLRYDAGALDYIASDIINDSTNPLYIGCFMDGETLRLKS